MSKTLVDKLVEINPFTSRLLCPVKASLITGLDYSSNKTLKLKFSCPTCKKEYTITDPDIDFLSNEPQAHIYEFQCCNKNNILYQYLILVDKNTTKTIDDEEARRRKIREYVTQIREELKTIDDYPLTYENAGKIVNFELLVHELGKYMNSEKRFIKEGYTSGFIEPKKL